MWDIVWVSQGAQISVCKVLHLLLHITYYCILHYSSKSHKLEETGSYDGNVCSLSVLCCSLHRCHSHDSKCIASCYLICVLKFYVLSVCVRSVGHSAVVLEDQFTMLALKFFGILVFILVVVSLFCQYHS